MIVMTISAKNICDRSHR